MSGLKKGLAKAVKGMGLGTGLLMMGAGGYAGIEFGNLLVQDDIDHKGQGNQAQLIEGFEQRINELNIFNRGSEKEKLSELGGDIKEKAINLAYDLTQSTLSEPNYSMLSIKFNELEVLDNKLATSAASDYLSRCKGFVKEDTSADYKNNYVVKINQCMVGSDVTGKIQIITMGGAGLLGGLFAMVAGVGSLQRSQKINKWASEGSKNKPKGNSLS